MSEDPPTGEELEAIAALEARVLAVDGVALKLEWPALRQGRAVAVITEAIDGALVGCAVLHTFGGPPDVEITGMVDPAHRGRGLGRRLLDRALAVCASGGFTRRLLIVPRESAGGAALATEVGGQLEHTEYGMLLAGDPTPVAADPRVELRPAASADTPALARILEAGFGPPPPALLEHLHTERADTWMVSFDGAAVGTIRLARDGAVGSVYGFAVDPEFRGRGIGRDVLHRACRQLRAGGADRVRLEVEVENDSALHLYTSSGFTPVRTDDYYRLP